MKHFFLPVLSWALAISPIFAQKALPTSIQPYAVHWSYAVKGMLNAAGYEVPGPKAEFDLLPVIDTRSDELQLDSTVSYFGYVANTPDSTPLFRNVYTYPSPEVQVVVESFFDQDHWIPLSRTALISDDLGRMVAILAQVYDEETGEFVPDSRIELFPRGDSPELIDSFFISAWSVEAQDYVRTFSVLNAFDDQDRLKESISTIEIFQVPIVFIDRYTYNTQNDLILIESFNVDGGEEFPAGRQELWYNDHLLTLITTLESDGLGGFIPLEKSQYTYTTSRQEELVNTYDFDFEKNDWRLIKVDGYVYDDEQRVTLKELVMLNDQDVWDRHKTTYEYVKDQYVYTESGFSYDFNLEDWVLEDRKYFYYNELVAVDPNQPEIVDALFMYPNPTSGIVQVKLVGKIAVHVYSLSGQLVQRYYLAPGEKTLDLSSLPAGMYQVRAQSDDDYYSGKLIIQ